MKDAQCYPVCLVLGGVGALMGCLAELTSKGEVSTLLRVREALSTYLGISTEPIYIMVLFVVLGVVLTFASQVSDLKKSLYVGASIITIFLTIIPNGLPPSVGSDPQSEVSKANEWRWYSFLGPDEALAQPFRGVFETGRVQVDLSPKDGKKISEAVLTVREPSSGRIVARSKFGSETIIFVNKTGKYLLVIEVRGYQVQTREIDVTVGRVEHVAVNLEPTWRPLPLQRLFLKH